MYGIFYLLGSVSISIEWLVYHAPIAKSISLRVYVNWHPDPQKPPHYNTPICIMQNRVKG